MLMTILRRTSITVVSLLVVLTGYVYVRSEWRLRTSYDKPLTTLVVPGDSATVARGDHLYHATISCALCHGDDGGGKMYEDNPRVVTVAGPNLTRGKGSVVADFTDADFVRAIRHGLRRDSTSLVLMPSEVYVNLADEDLAAIIAYIKQLPAVDREMPRVRFGPIGRALLSAGKLNILVAPKTPNHVPVTPVPGGPTAQYGEYITRVTGCKGCHGNGLSGGRVAGPPNLPPASNLTPKGIGHWTEADFVRAMREGKRPDGSAINEFMPWKAFGRMSDDELRALWLYLQSVPGKEFGNK